MLDKVRNIFTCKVRNIFKVNNKAIGIILKPFFFNFEHNSHFPLLLLLLTLKMELLAGNIFQKSLQKFRPISLILKEEIFGTETNHHTNSWKSIELVSDLPSE